MPVDKVTIALDIFVEDGLVTVVMVAYEEALGIWYVIAVEKNISVKNRLLQGRRSNNPGGNQCKSRLLVPCPLWKLTR